MGAVIAIAISVVIMEIYAWIPKASNWLCEQALRKLCPELQERCREEWQADLDAAPNSLIRLLWALGCNKAVDRTNYSLYQQRYDVLDCSYNELSDIYVNNLRKMNELRISISYRETNICKIQRSLEELELSASSAAGNLVIRLGKLLTNY
jgi:hypothetical protein